MSADGQFLTVLAVILVAVVYLLRRGWLILAGKGGGCSSCAKCSTPEEQNLVQIDSLDEDSP
jgi:hypothetical protein